MKNIFRNTLIRNAKSGQKNRSKGVRMSEIKSKDNKNNELNGIYKLDEGPTNSDPSFRLNYVKTDEHGLKMGAERIRPNEGCHISIIKDGMAMTRTADGKKFQVNKTDKVKWYIWLSEIQNGLN